MTLTDTQMEDIRERRKGNTSYPDTYFLASRDRADLLREVDRFSAENATLREQRDAMRKALDGVNIWLKAALKCANYHWDVDQYEAATECVTAADAALSPDRKGP